MDRSNRGTPGQAGSDRSARPALAYAQIPLILLKLPTSERAAAIEVWTTLHQHLRLGTAEQKISDEVLSQSPYLEGRSAEHARKGLEILERLGLIVRTAKGSSRSVALLGRLKGAQVDRPGKTAAKHHILRVEDMVRPPAPTPETDATVKRFFPSRGTSLLVQGN